MMTEVSLIQNWEILTINMLYSSRKSIALQEELTKVDDLLKMVEETN